MDTEPHYKFPDTLRPVHNGALYEDGQEEWKGTKWVRGAEVKYRTFNVYNAPYTIKLPEGI
jgi:hypothetical protein